MLKPWQVSAMINMIYNKKDIVISADTRFDNSLLYQLISLIRDKVIVLVVSPTIALMTDQVYLPVIIFYYKF